MKRFLFVFLFFYLWGSFFGIKIARASVDDNGRGFLWTNNFGWISLNCWNNWSETTASSQCAGPGGNYGVKINLFANGEGNMVGYAWSPYLGLICFGTTCSITGLSPNGASPEIVFNLNAVEIIGGERVALLQGWARVIGHKDQGINGGWIQFDGNTNQGDEVQVGIRAGDRGLVEIRGAAWQRNSNGSGIGWIYFGPSPPGGVPEDAEGDAGYDEEIHLPPPFDCEINEICSGTPTDNDCDESYTGAPDANPLTGRYCQDYDCAGAETEKRGFYSSNFLVNSEPFCGVLAASVEYRENALSDRDCFDEVDNDLDHLMDCQDPDCANAELPEQNLMCSAEFLADEFSFCFDGIDNDGDGLRDCNDLECTGSELCQGENILIGHEQCGSLAAGEECASECPEGENDADRDLVCSPVDNCPNIANSTQVDSNGNEIGDECDAFLETQQGSIYTSRIRVAKPLKPPTAPVEKFTATYCILASAQGLAPFNAESQLCQLPSDQAVSEFRLRQYQDTVALLPSLTQQTLLSYIDIAGLKNGRYGNVVTLRDSASSFSDDIENGNARVIYSPADLNLIGQDIIIPANRGAVTVLVEGNLLFGEDTKIIYNTASAPDLKQKQIASIAWIVVDPNLGDNIPAGNIIIDPSVSDLVGAMFAANTISTGDDRNNLQPFTAQGLMIARQFNFQRRYRPIAADDEIKGAELIIYDGRAAINPPPGLADFIKTLPISRNVAPR